MSRNEGDLVYAHIIIGTDTDTDIVLGIGWRFIPNAKSLLLLRRAPISSHLLRI